VPPPLAEAVKDTEAPTDAAFGVDAEMVTPVAGDNDDNKP
jgi:hypothetical protein